MSDPQPLELGRAIGEVAETFDRAGVGREVGLAAFRAIPVMARQNDPEIVEETIQAATSNVAAIMDGLLAGLDPDAVPVPSVSLRWVDRLVARGIDVSTIPWAFNLGNGRMADALREVVHSLDLSGEERWQLSDGLTRYVQAYVECISAQLVNYYVRVSETQRSGTGARRRALVQSLLNEESLDPVTVGRDLGYDLRQPHLAAVVWSCDAEAAPSAAALESAARGLLRACGATQVLSVANGDRSAWAWGSGTRLTDAPDAGAGVEDAMLAAIGTIAIGVSGFVDSHRDAQRARHVARLLGRRPRSIVPYRSVALTALLAQDPVQAARFVEAELGALTEPTDSARRLRATLAIYLEEGMRPVRAARRLGVHQNTVAYRVTQAETAIGRPLTERRLELETALRLAEALDTLRGIGTTPQTPS